MYDYMVLWPVSCVLYIMLICSDPYPRSLYGRVQWVDVNYMLHTCDIV